MRMIISPAKKMREDTDTLPAMTTPVFLDRAGELKDWLNAMDAGTQQKLWACNEKIAAQNRERFLSMDLQRNLTPAVLSYDGIQYQYMAPAVLEESALSYLQEHLRILSGFYGVLRPMDGVVPYRLEMQAKGAPGRHKDLYDYWKDAIYEETVNGDHLILNLASKEYAKCIEPCLQKGDVFITCVFAEKAGGKPVTKGVYAKMARGSMVRFLAERGAKDPEEAKSFDIAGYHFDPERSTDTEYVFVRSAVPGKPVKQKRRG